MQSIPKKIVVEDHNKIFMLQEEFNQAFPYLKIEFFSVANKQGQLIVNKFTSENSRALGGYRNSHNNEQIVITPEITVAALEEKFNKIYGLGAQVLRKSGKIWLEATVTDVWTLEEQNRQGEALSKSVN
jgi:hypothetical protein